MGIEAFVVEQEEAEQPQEPVELGEPEQPQELATASESPGIQGVSSAIEAVLSPATTLYPISSSAVGDDGLLSLFLVYLSGIYLLIYS